MRTVGQQWLNKGQNGSSINLQVYLILTTFIFCKANNYRMYSMDFNVSKPKRQDEFGPTYDLHQALMAVLWGPGINLAIVLAMYSYRKYYVYLHICFGAFVTVYSIGTALPILFTTGIISESGKDGITPSQMYAHYVVGISALCAIFLQAALGVATKLGNVYQFSSSSVIVLKYAHTILGYLVALLSKSNVYIIYWNDGSFWLFFVQDFLFAGLIIARKIVFPKMKKVILPEDSAKTQKRIRAYKSLAGLDQQDSYCIFSNLIYSLAPLKSNHPAGNQVIEAVKNRDVDPFIYGMYSTEAVPQVSQHSHSFRSLTLLGDPVGLLRIPSNYGGFRGDQEEIGWSNVNVKKISEMSKQGRVYEVQLQRAEERLSFRNYEDILQLGRFYSLSTKDTTRLYTSVNCLRCKNKRLMLAYFGESIAKEEIVYKREEQRAVEKGYVPPNEEETDMMAEEQDYIPLLIKVYAGGELTDKLIRDPEQELRISHEKGLGLQLSALGQHKIVIIAGGTGFFPFYDTLDLFFKSELMNLPHCKEALKKELLVLDPILSKYSFGQLHFEVYLAVNSIDQIHPIIYQQLLFLLKHSAHFTLTLRCREELTVSLNSELTSFRRCKIASGRFQEILQDELKGKEVSRIFVCGPPRMNQSLSKFFSQRENLKDLVHFM